MDNSIKGPPNSIVLKGHQMIPIVPIMKPQFKKGILERRYLQREKTVHD